MVQIGGVVHKIVGVQHTKARYESNGNHQASLDPPQHVTMVYVYLNNTIMVGSIGMTSIAAASVATQILTPGHFEDKGRQFW